MAGFTLFNTNIVEIFNIFLSFSLCYAQKGWHAVKLSIDSTTRVFNYLVERCNETLVDDTMVIKLKS